MRTLFGNVVNGGTCLSRCRSLVTPGELPLPLGGRARVSEPTSVLTRSVINGECAGYRVACLRACAS